MALSLLLPAGEVAKLVLAFAVGLLAGQAGPAKADTIRGTEMKGFGRIAFAFDRPTKVTARSVGSVLVLSFSDRVGIRSDRLPVEMPSYVAVARTDPDRGAIRLGLSRPFRTNILEIGEKVFVDLLPEAWTGLPPPLPQDVVEAMARRAREAEAKLREGARGMAPAPVPGAIRVARLPNTLRLSFQVPASVSATFSTDGGEAQLVFKTPVAFDQSEARNRLEPAVRSMAIDAAQSGPRVRLVIAEGYQATEFRDEDGYVVDVSGKTAASKPGGSGVLEGSLPPPGAAAPAVPPSAPEPMRSPDRLRESKAQPVEEPPDPPANDRGPERSGESKARPVEPPAGPPPQAAKEKDLPAAGPAKAVPVVAAEAVRPDVIASRERLSLRFRFAQRTAAVAFERAGTLTAVFETKQQIEIPPALAGGDAAFLSGGEAKAEGPFVVLRFALKRQPSPIQLVPVSETEWLLTVGEAEGPPPARLASVPTPDESGRAALVIPVKGASGVHWLESGDGAEERVAVVTAFDPPSGLPKPQRFQQFRLLPTAHGVALTADADDLLVSTSPGKVIVSRPDGLALSLVERAREEGKPADLVIERGRWTALQGGPVLAKARELLGEAAEAPRPGRNPHRLALAEFFLANGLEPEASSVLTVALGDDAALARQPKFQLLNGIVSVRTGRDAEARRLLGADMLSGNPEAELWLAVLDARARRWPQALAGFRRSAAVLDRYPDELQAELRAQAAEVALEQNEAEYAADVIGKAHLVADGRAAVHRIDLLKARVDELRGEHDDAIDLFKHLAHEAEPPTAAEAGVRWVSAALKRGSMPADEAIRRLEDLALAWRGDEVEARTLATLGRLYAEAGRWRDAFRMASLANRLFPDLDVTRGLHDETARLFEELFHSGNGPGLPRVEALGLYFDFKEFTPVGRVGDEIVRRLADRLVELDLPDEAANLLQHQVDHRLTGGARATVAARLATVRLMAGQPQAALAALRSTWMPELPPETMRARLLLEARALSDLSRTDLALETLEGESGPEVDRLRADILWTARRWREAGEAHEVIVGSKWRDKEPLTDQDRTDVTRAAIAYALAEEKLGLDRLRTRFAAKMADGPDARTFSFLTQPDPAQPRAAAGAAAGVSRADMLAEFLREYRKRYPDALSGKTPASASASDRVSPGGGPQAPQTP